ncbi:MAG TPA: response regulator, partial [Bacilli bacterium]|nr:response regulator [Bacilli bacterium]
MKDINVLVNNGVNVQGSLELFGDMTMYDDTLVDFLDGVDEKVEGLKKYKETSDMPNYAILVHSLKSDARYLGFTKLAELSYQHEMESKANNVAYVYNNYDALMAETNRIIGVAKTYLGRTSNNSVPEFQIPEPVVIKDKTILVVDDSDIIRNFVHKIFSSSYQVVHAKDGREAIDILGTSSSNIVAMLLDLNMPNVDGFAVLEYFEENNLFVKIPVSIITGDDSRDTINRTFSYPITDVLQKPFNERDVKAIIDKMLQFNQ